MEKELLHGERMSNLDRDDSYDIPGFLRGIGLALST